MNYKTIAIMHISIIIIIIIIVEQILTSDEGPEQLVIFSYLFTTCSLAVQNCEKNNYVLI